jgi:hypothetical protein
VDGGLAAWISVDAVAEVTMERAFGLIGSMSEFYPKLVVWTS